MRPNGAICITTVLLLLLAIQRQRTQFFGFILMTERWLNEHNGLLLAAALLREQNRQRRRLRRAPYAWRLPRVKGMVGRARHLTVEWVGKISPVHVSNRAYEMNEEISRALLRFVTSPSLSGVDIDNP